MQIVRRMLRVLGMEYTLATLGGAQALHSFPQDHRVLQPGEQLEVLRDYVSFGEGRAGQRTAFKTVKFSKSVLSAEVFISGINVWNTREDRDREVMAEQVDAWVTQINVNDDMSKVLLKFMYTMKDEDTGDGDDFNDCCIGFTVIARTM